MKHNNIVQCVEDDLVKMITDTYSSDCTFTDVKVIEATIDKWVVRVIGKYKSGLHEFIIDDLVFVSQFTQSYYRIER